MPVTVRKPNQGRMPSGKAPPMNPGMQPRERVVPGTGLGVGAAKDIGRKKRK